MSDINELVARLATFETNVENRFSALDKITKPWDSTWNATPTKFWSYVKFPRTLLEVVNLLKDIQIGKYSEDIQILSDFIERSPEAGGLEAFMTSSWVQQLAVVLRESGGNANLQKIIEDKSI